MRDLETKFGNVDYQQRLAETLANTQGFDAAVRSCQEFGWDGVLDHLLNTRGAQRPGAPEQPHR